MTLLNEFTMTYVPPTCPDDQNCVKLPSPPKQKHKPGGDQYCKPPPGYVGSCRWMNWHGFRVKTGAGYSPFLFNELQRRRRNIEASIIVITGRARKGKTYMAIRLGEIMDAGFNPDTQIPFGGQEFINLISETSPLKMGQYIVPDEAQFAAGARTWYDDIQKDLMNQLEGIGSKGYTIILVALSIKVLDNIARNYIITHHIHMTKRGEGIAYEYYMPPFATEPYKRKLGTIRVKMPGYETCRHGTCLRCKHSGLPKDDWARRAEWDAAGFVPCMNLRARYERKKKVYLQEHSDAMTEKRRKRTAKFPEKKLLEDLVSHPEMLKVTRSGKVSYVSVKTFVETRHPDVNITDRGAHGLADKYEILYPEAMAKVPR